MSKNLRLSILIISITLIIVIIAYRNINKNQIIHNSIGKNNFTISGKAKIIDGDSIMIKKYEIRLFDIDAPEYNQICLDNNDKEYNCGSKATLYLKELTKNTKLQCRVSGRDYYDRYLATCFKNKININEKMISEGWAVIYNNPSEYYHLMLKAKLEQKGLWQGKFLEPKQFRKQNRKKKIN